MTKKPNNFPRVGVHSPVTRDAIKRLEAERPTPNAEMHYTIGGSVETVVHSNANAEREAAIVGGTRRLSQSSQDLRAAFQPPKGKSRAAYIREQKTLAEHWRAQQRTKTHTRSP